MICYKETQLLEKLGFFGKFLWNKSGRQNQIIGGHPVPAFFPARALSPTSGRGKGRAGQDAHWRDGNGNL